jgi:anti-sigma regulatory factor (Ser/Thr protein kinase)
MQEGYSTAPDNVRQLGFGAGMGLPNIKKYTDEMVIETEVGRGTAIHLKVYVQ